MSNDDRDDRFTSFHCQKGCSLVGLYGPSYRTDPVKLRFLSDIGSQPTYGLTEIKTTPGHQATHTLYGNTRQCWTVTETMKSGFFA